MSLKTATSDRVLLALAILVADAVVFVVPLAGLLAAYVVVARPPWFREWVTRLYVGAVSSTDGRASSVEGAVSSTDGRASSVEAAVPSTDGRASSVEGEQ